MKFLLISDIHLSERPPSSCTDAYCDDLFNLLEQAHAVGRERDVEAMVWAGDVFHHKAPNRVSHRLVQRTSEFISAAAIPVLVLAGNHDMSNDRYESVFESQPLGVLYRAGAQELRGWAGVLPIYGVPWLQGYGDYGAYEGDDPLSPIEVRLTDALKDYKAQVFERGTGEHTPLVVTHAPLYPPGKELRYEWFPADRWTEAMTGITQGLPPAVQGSNEGRSTNGGGRHAVFYGHVHEPHGEYGFYGSDPKFGDYSVTFCNNGALSRGSLHEYNLTRKVGVTIYDTLTAKFEFVPLNAKPASEVFRLTEKGRATDLQGRMDEFLTGVGSTTLEVMSAEAVIAHIRSMGLGADVEALAEELLAEAQHGKGHQ